MLPKFISTVAGVLISVAVLVTLSGCGGASATKIVVVTATPQSGHAALLPTRGSTSATATARPRFDRTNWAALQTDPDSYKGASVNIVGHVFISPQKDARGTYWQMWSDPKNSDWNTLVDIQDPNFQISNGDYVRVAGIVKGSYQGTNGFGGDVTAVEIVARTATVVNALAAASPALRTLRLSAAQVQNGVTITVTKLEFAADETRAFVSVANGSNSTAHFYDFDAKAVQGTTEFSSDSSTDYTTIQSDILTGVTSSGVVVFPRMDPNQPTKLVFSAGSDNYNLNFQPYQFHLAGGSASVVTSLSSSTPGAQSPGSGSSAQAEIMAALATSNQAWASSMQCACDQGLESAKTGSDLQNNLASVNNLQSKGEHWMIVDHSFAVDSIDVKSSTAADAQVSKSETNTLYQGTTVIQICTGSYQVQYHLQQSGGVWKVGGTQVVGNGLTCH